MLSVLEMRFIIELTTCFVILKPVSRFIFSVSYSIALQNVYVWVCVCGGPVSFESSGNQVAIPKVLSYYVRLLLLVFTVVAFNF